MFCKNLKKFKLMYFTVLNHVYQTSRKHPVQIHQCLCIMYIRLTRDTSVMKITYTDKNNTVFNTADYT